MFLVFCGLFLFFLFICVGWGDFSVVFLIVLFFIFFVFWGVLLRLGEFIFSDMVLFCDLLLLWVLWVLWVLWGLLLVKRFVWLLVGVLMFSLEKNWFGCRNEFGDCVEWLEVVGVLIMYFLIGERGKIFVKFFMFILRFIGLLGCLICFFWVNCLGFIVEDDFVFFCFFLLLFFCVGVLGLFMVIEICWYYFMGRLEFFMNLLGWCIIFFVELLFFCCKEIYIYYLLLYKFFLMCGKFFVMCIFVKCE